MVLKHAYLRVHKDAKTTRQRTHTLCRCSVLGRAKVTVRAHCVKRQILCRKGAFHTDEPPEAKGFRRCHNTHQREGSQPGLCRTKFPWMYPPSQLLAFVDNTQQCSGNTVHSVSQGSLPSCLGNRVMLGTKPGVPTYQDRLQSSEPPP